MTTTMLAAVFEGNGVLKVRQVPKPDIARPDDVLIRVDAASICGSDLHVLHIPPGQYAKPGTILGHEFCGHVEAVGEKVTKYQPGDYVVVDNIMKCHVCEYCRTGRDNLCPNAEIFGQTLPGGFAQYCVIPEAQLYHMPESVPAYLAAQTEPLACVMNAMQKLNPTPADNVLIYGTGPIGLTFIRVMRLYGVRNLAICEMSETRRKTAVDCGAGLALDPAQDLEKAITEAWGEACDIIVDAVGVGPVFGQAIRLLKCGGRQLIFGQNANAVSQVPPAVIVRNELTVMGSYCAHNTFPVAIRLLCDSRLGLERIISKKMELADILDGLDLLKSQKASRVIIYPNGAPD